MQLINERDGGVNGVKLTWEECETEYNNARGVECYERLKKKGSTGNTVFQPVSTGITYSVLEKVAQDKIPMVTIGYGRTDAADGRVFPWVFPLITTYWSQASAIVKLHGPEGRRHGQAEGQEDRPALPRLRLWQGIPRDHGQAGQAKHGFEVIKIAVAHPGNEQQSQWLQIRQAKPDYVVLWGWGVMNPTAIKAAAKTGFPREKLIGVWWSGAEVGHHPEPVADIKKPPRAWKTSRIGSVPASTWPRVRQLPGGQDDARLNQEDHCAVQGEVPARRQGQRWKTRRRIGSKADITTAAWCTAIIDRRMAASYLSINNIEVIYDHVILVLKGVSLQVPQGKIVALLGANGAGKSTTLKSISNLLRAERGDVTKGSVEFKGSASTS
jgi:hypothetical protein